MDIIEGTYPWIRERTYWHALGNRIATRWLPGGDWERETTGKMPVPPEQIPHAHLPRLVQDGGPGHWVLLANIFHYIHELQAPSLGFPTNG